MGSSAWNPLPPVGNSLWDGIPVQDADWSREDVAPSPSRTGIIPFSPNWMSSGIKIVYFSCILYLGRNFFLEKGDFGSLDLTWMFGMLQLHHHWITLPLNPG